MKPIALRMYRFGSFLTEQEFRFPSGPGLYHLRGANGGGKSTVWKALTWVLFGKDPRGLKAGDAANWEQPKGARVEFEFEHNGVKHIVRRTHAPNSWEMGDAENGSIDLAKDDGNALQSMLRLSYDTWLHAVLIAQRADMFLDLKPEPKATLFSTVTGLDYWIERSDVAAEKVKAADVDMRRLETDIAGVVGQLARIHGDDVDKRVAEWEAERNKRVAVIEADYNVAIDCAAGFKEKLAPAGAAVRDAEQKLRGWIDTADLANHAVTSARSSSREAGTASALASREVERLEALYKLLETSHECPTCGTSGSNLRPALGRVNEDLAKADTTARQAADAARNAASAHCNAEAAFQRLQASVQTARQNRQVAVDHENQCRRQQESAERDLDNLEAQAERTINERNPYADLQEQAAFNREQLLGRLRTLQSGLADATERHALLGFWVRGFKDIRLRRIAENLDGLAVETNGRLTELGLADWEIVYEVDRETLAGTVKRGFSTFVKSPANSRQVPWESWSGGEAQRLRVAAQQGLSNLIRAAGGVDIPLEVWDEPTDGMEAEGIDALLASMEARACREHLQIFITDHRALGHGGFAGSIEVVKTAAGSQIGEWQ